MAVKKITLENGFKANVDEIVLDDMELVELLAVLEDDQLKLPKVISMILGDDQKAKLYDHLRTDDGRVPIPAVNEALEDLFKKLGEDAKN